MKKSDLKILFMGTPEFAKENLKHLVDNNFNVVGVFTNPDKPKGRDLKPNSSLVKQYAISKKIPVYQPIRLKENKDVVEILNNLNPDIIIVVAYGKILPKYILDFPRFGCVNIHASLLPRYRGAAPINWAIINREKTTGITIMYMDDGMDTGDIISKTELKIDTDDTFMTIHDKLLDLAKPALVEVLEAIINDKKINRQKQTGNYSIAPMLTNENTKIDFRKDVQSILGLIKGTNPLPLAWCKLDNDRQYQIYEAVEVSKSEIEFILNIDKEYLTRALKGEIIYINDKKNMLIIKCDNSYINITKLKPKNSKIMTAAEYIRGNKIKIKERFI